VMSEAVLEVLLAPRHYSRNDGLFLVIARRRASDFWRHRKVERSFRASASTSLPDRERIDSVLIGRSLLRFVRGRTDLEKQRLLEVARAAIEGSSFAEACRIAGIPRGSQGRYREILKEFLAYLARLQSRGRAPTQ
jgi:DNA-directed RNA polymerase specialized sigma24 family protein